MTMRNELAARGYHDRAPAAEGALARLDVVGVVLAAIITLGPLAATALLS